MADFLLQGAVSNALNMPSVSAEDAPKLKPYMKLAEQLGGFAGQLVSSDVQGIQVEYEGLVAGLNTRPLTALITAGFLKPSMSGVNIVSAPAKLKELGIQLAETKREMAKDYHTLIRIVVTTKTGENTVEGTLFSGEHPRIINIDGVPIETALSGHMLYIQNHDKPGLIGAVGTILGDAKVNIADFNLGRIPGKNKAIALVSTDDPVNEETLAKIAKLGLSKILTGKFMNK